MQPRGELGQRAVARREAAAVCGELATRRALCGAWPLAVLSVCCTPLPFLQMAASTVHGAAAHSNIPQQSSRKM